MSQDVLYYRAQRMKPRHEQPWSIFRLSGGTGATWRSGARSPADWLLRFRGRPAWLVRLSGRCRRASDPDRPSCIARSRRGGTGRLHCRRRSGSFGMWGTQKMARSLAWAGDTRISQNLFSSWPSWCRRSSLNQRTSCRCFFTICRLCRIWTFRSPHPRRPWPPSCNFRCGSPFRRSRSP